MDDLVEYKHIESRLKEILIEIKLIDHLINEKEMEKKYAKIHRNNDKG